MNNIQTLEEKISRLMDAIYKDRELNVYDFCAEEWKDDEETFMNCKGMADELVDEKLARYLDEKRTQLAITNFGRYWAVHGGYLLFLKEGEKKIKHDGHHKHHDNPDKEKHHEEIKEELKEARLKFTHYRIVTYWWSFAVSVISFMLSLLSLYLILTKK